TFGNDIMPRLSSGNTRRVVFYTRGGLFISTALAVVLALWFRSVVDIWHIFGSIGVPALLVPVFTSFVGRRRLPPGAANLSILLSGGVASLWYLSKVGHSSYWLGLEPIFPGLAVSLVVFALTARETTQPLPD
ncbi:MAG: hypothetical protein D6800_05535, partial [Candidatus Zixiibacteriota bacterium]